MAASETRVTRGKLLKRAGVGAAVLGAGSLITAGTAGADSPPSLACLANGCNFNVSCSSGACCYCNVTTEGCCFCIQNAYCVGLKTCISSKQCPPGWACIANACSVSGVCAPHCGAGGPHVIPCGTGVSTTRRTING